MKLEDLLASETLPVLGVGSVLALLVFPALRPQVAGAMKAGARLYLEAEVGADDILAEQLADATVRGLMGVSESLSPQDRERDVDRHLAHFAAKAQHSARRRGFDEHDIERRYEKRISRLERAISSARHRARPSQSADLDHAASSLNNHRQRHARRTDRSEAAQH